MSNIKISVIVPVYNSGNYIKNTIKSILAQSLSNLELILVNDGSTDNSKDILDEYAKVDSRIKVIHQENRGVSAARNKGISIACGDYLGFVDSDDLIDSDMYELMYNKAISCSADILTCGFIEEDTKGNVLRTYDYPFPNDILKDEDIKTKFIYILDNNLETLGGGSMCTKIFKRSFLKKYNISIDENITIGEDLSFNIKAFYHASIIAGIDKKFYHYMSVNPNSIMTKLDDKKFIKFIEGRMWILKTLDKYNLSSKNYSQFEYSRNFANLIQIADYKLSNSNSLGNKYHSTIEILKSQEIKDSINLTDNKYLSKNLQLIKKLIQYHLYFVVFLIMYIRTSIKK